MPTPAVAGDVLERHLGAPGGEGLGGGGEQEVAVAHRIGAGTAIGGYEAAGSIDPLIGPRDVPVPPLFTNLTCKTETASVYYRRRLPFPSLPHLEDLQCHPTATLVVPATAGNPSASPAGASCSRIILAVQLMVVLDATIVNIALPDIAGALHFSPANLSWVITAYTLAFGGFLLLGARAGDLLGRRRVFIAGIALFTAASFLGGLAPWSGWLLAARALQGVGGALAAPSALALLMTMFRGRPGAGPRDRLVHGRVHRRRSRSASSSAACSSSGRPGAGCCSSTCRSASSSSCLRAVCSPRRRAAMATSMSAAHSPRPSA